MVDFDKGDFIGREVLQTADKRRRTWGLRVACGIAHLGKSLSLDGAPAGVVCSTAWSPFQRCGVSLVRVDDADLGTGTRLEVECSDGQTHTGELCETPMYDQKREIPRGILVDIPEIPIED